MIEINNVTFQYKSESSSGGIRNISLSIPQGEVVVLCGESGCGKTTITRLINGLIPHFFEGELSGSVLVDEQNVSVQPLYDTAKLVGSVFQNPRSQFFNVDTTSELSFGCENLGMPREEILSRLDRTVSALRLEKLLDRSIFDLSGGEKQKIACGGVFMMEPQVFVLDEPSSNLDSDSIPDLRSTIAYLKSLGKTVVLSEHRLYYLRGIADRYIYVKDGSITAVYTADQFDRISEDERSAMGLRTNDLSSLRGNTTAGRSTASALLSDFHFAYKHAPETLRIDSCEIPYGGIIGIIGHNGAGKSTFSRCFCGLEKRCGTVTVNGTSYRPKDRLNNCYMVMQEVGHQLFTESVLDEVLISMADENEDIARSILEKLDLSSLADRHPASLSGGQKQRLAIASAIAAKRPVVFLDEPTSGLDYRHMTEVAELLKSLHKDGKTIYVITHDPELICECCTDILHLEDGTITECYPMDAAGVNKIRDFFRIA
jgi:energy-coupling factor transport system ATP-binding protein